MENHHIQHGIRVKDLENVWEMRNKMHYSPFWAPCGALKKDFDYQKFDFFITFFFNHFQFIFFIKKSDNKKSDKTD